LTGLTWLTSRSPCEGETSAALRARRTDEFNIHNLKTGQALIGDYRRCGLTHQQYRTAQKHLALWGLAAFKPTSRGTVATLLDHRIYDINDTPAQQTNNKQTTNDQQTGNKQPTTNKNDKNEKNEKKEKAELLCELLSQEIRRRKSDFCEPPREQWLEPMAAMLELDGRSAERVEAVIQWSQRDPFWSVNILSPAALRKHFDRLELEMARVGTGESESLAQRLARLERAEGPSRRPHGIATMAVERDRRSPEAACRGFSTPTRRSRPYRRSDPGSLSQTSVVSARPRPARFCHLVLKEISFRFARLVVV